MFKATLRRIGNSVGVILPTELLRYLHLQEGETLDVSADAHRIIMAPEIEGDDFEKVLREVISEDEEILASLVHR